MGLFPDGPRHPVLSGIYSWLLGTSSSSQNYLHKGLTAVIEAYGISTPTWSNSWRLAAIKPLEVYMYGQLKLCKPHIFARIRHSFGIFLIWNLLADSTHFLPVFGMFQGWMLQCDMTSFGCTALNTCDFLD